MKLRHIIMALAAGAVLAAPAAAVTSLTFGIAGDTFAQPFVITNTSTAGETVTGFGLKLVSPYIFDTVEGGPGTAGALIFTPTAGSVATTGYTGPAAFPDGTDTLAFTFTNFNVGESFAWRIDVDQGNVIIAVFGSDLIGASAFVDFSDGSRINGVLAAVPGNPTAAQLITVPEPATWAMLLIGFGAVGAVLRRRTTPVAA